eukprot:6867481-Alexandrium_andersonii.AAC.1
MHDVPCGVPSSAVLTCVHVCVRVVRCSSVWYGSLQCGAVRVRCGAVHLCVRLCVRSSGALECGVVQRGAA